MTILTNLHKQFATSLDKEETGVWKDFDDGISIRVRRLNSKAALAARTEAEKPHTLRARNGTLPDDINEDIAIHQLARGVIADWKGIKDGEGNEIPYSGDVAYAILRDETMKDFRTEIITLSADRDSYKAAADKEALGN